MSYTFTRADLEQELKACIEEEAIIDGELREYFTSLATSKSSSSRVSSFDSADLHFNVKKVEAYLPAFEAMSETSKKLVSQVDECNSLSDRLSKKVRKLNKLQKRAQEALTLTENIISMKVKRTGIREAIDEGKYMAAVGLLQDVMKFDVRILETSEDYAHINILKDELREKVKNSFIAAINSSNLDEVMSLCPGLQTLGLEVEARDLFIDFMVRTVFIAVSIDAVVANDSLDTATAYVQTLSNLFNSAHLILQKYLPMVIQGMLHSNGDIIFIQKLHAKCESEAILLLKRYLHFRKANETIDAIKSSGNSSTLQGGKITQSDVHTLLDELSLLIQYCCVFSRYIGHLCGGAEQRSRPSIGDKGNGESVKIKVFNGSTELERGTQKLIIDYYMVAEKWILKNCIRNALPRVAADTSVSSLAKWKISNLDDCFYVLLRTGQRAIACNSFFAADCVLTEIIGLLAKPDDFGNEERLAEDLVALAIDYVDFSVAKLIEQLQEHLQKFLRTSSNANTGSAGPSSSASDVASTTIAALDSSSVWLKSLMSLSAGPSYVSSSSTTTMSSHRNTSSDNLSSAKNEEDFWNVSALLESFNNVEKCIKYCDRLSRDLLSSASQVFVERNHSNSSSKQSSPAFEDNKRLNLRKEEFDRAKLSFQHVLRSGIDRIKNAVQGILKDLLSINLGRKGPLGGVRFDLVESEFDAQQTLSLLPKLLTIPIDTIMGICTTGLSETNKDLVVSLLADACSDELINYISQNSFRFSGALKFEELVRAITSIFTRASSVPIRGKFSRLREILLVLTSDRDSTSHHSTSFMFSESFAHLSPQDIQSFSERRLD